MASNLVTDPIDTDDTFLVQRFILQNDDDAFRQLVQRHQRKLYDFVWRHIGNHEDVADICQQVFIQVFNKAKQFRGDASFKTWLYQIAINQCRTYYRKRQRRPEELFDPVQPPNHMESVAPLQADCAEEQRILNVAIENLPEKQRLTLRLHLYQDCSFQEIANILECPTGTVKANYHHAINNLRKTLNPNGDAST